MRKKVHDYKYKMPSEIKSSVERTLTNLRLHKSMDVDVYYLKGEHANYKAGRKDERLVVYLYASFKSSEQYTDRLIINGKETPYILYMNPKGERGNFIVKSEEGLPLAEYNPQNEEIAILVEMFQEYNKEILEETLNYIFEALTKEVFDKKAKEKSWKHNKENLIRTIEQVYKNQMIRQLQEDEQRLRNEKEKAETYQQKLKLSWDNIFMLMKRIESAKEENPLDKIVQQLDLITNHEKVKELIIEKEWLHVYTNPLNMTTEDGRVFHLGEMLIKINTKNSEVKFENLTNPRRSYWSSRDPHPHVDGTNGRACFGNVASTIAELCASNELYALTLIAIDFLEAVNTEDVAGRNVYNWDEIIDGEIIEPEERHEHDEEYDICHICEGDFPVSELRVAYDSADEDGVWNDVRVCVDCLHEHYEYSDEHDEYIHVDAYEE